MIASTHFPAGEPSASASEEFLFISHTLELGGIETLLVRMANAIASQGRKVTVASPDGPMRAHLDATVDYLEMQHVADLEFAPRNRNGCVYIWCSLPILMIRAWRLQKRLWRAHGAPSLCVSGIFHPDQWNFHRRFSVAYAIGRFIQALAEPGSIYFMNEATKRAHISRWGSQLAAFPVVKLHTSRSVNPTWKSSMRPNLKIVSVGRIEPFKTYNYDAIGLVRELANKDVPVEWDLFGDGADRTSLINAAEASGVGSKVRLPGTVAYNRFQSTLLSYDLFIGMGTAALEAAQVGIPTLLAVSNVPRSTYGYLFEAPLDSVGEEVLGYKPKSIVDAIADHWAASASERLAMGRRCAESVLKRSGDHEPPFYDMYRGSRRYPSTTVRAARAEILFLLQRLRQKMRFLLHATVQEHRN